MDYLATYQVLIPAVAVIGIAGNLFNLSVLLSSHQSEKVLKNGIMYLLLSSLAISDILYLLSSLQVCVFKGMGYFLEDCPTVITSMSLGFYLWNIMTPLSNTFCTISDICVASMTVLRFKVMKDIEKVSSKSLLSHKKSSKVILALILSGWVLSVGLHLPFYWQFDIVSCSITNASTATPTEASVSANESCWTEKESLMSHTVVWHVYGYCYQVIAKAMPMLLIFALNICIIIKVRVIMVKRRRLREGRRRQQPGNQMRQMKRLNTQVPKIVCEQTSSGVVADLSGAEASDFNPNSSSISGSGCLFLQLGPQKSKPISDLKPSDSSLASTLKPSRNTSDPSSSPQRCRTISEQSSGVAFSVESFQKSQGSNLLQPVDNNSQRRLSNASTFKRTILQRTQSFRELRMTSLLIVLALSHCLLTIPGNLSFLLRTNFPHLWISFKDRNTYDAVASTMFCINYSKNFFLYCITHKDFRSVALHKLKALKAKVIYGIMSIYKKSSCREYNV